MTVTVACIRMITKIERLYEKKYFDGMSNELVGIYRLLVESGTDF